MDFVFGGNAKEQFIFTDGIEKIPHWWGRRVNLDKTLLEGNGQIKMYLLSNNKLIYTQSFSTLFQEWLTSDQATKENRSFESVQLLPFPKEKVRVEVVLKSNLGIVQASYQQEVDPKDILIRSIGLDHLQPYEYLSKSTQKHPIYIAIVAEGYQQNEMDAFYKAAQQAVQELFKHKAFKNNMQVFTIVAVGVPSIDSGISVPRDDQWKNTVLSSHFDTFYSERYLTTSNVKKMHDALAGVPYDHIIVLANTNVYGGGGIFNSYTLTTTGHKKFAPVVVHEFGHSFAGLADEYFYASDVLDGFVSNVVEPWERNITTLKNFDTKWKHKLKKKTPVPTPKNQASKYPIGVYEGLEGNGIYKATLDCRMLHNESNDFCEICTDAIEELIHFYTR